MGRIKLLLLLSFVSFVATHAQRTKPYSPQRVYHVEEPGTLHKVLDVEDIKTEFRIFYKKNKDNRHAQDDWYQSSFDNIKITGRINCFDLMFLSGCDDMEVEGTDRFSPDFFGKIDLSEATIIGSDSIYRYSLADRNTGQNYVSGSSVARSSPENDRIGAYAFDGICTLDKVIFPNNLKSIHEYAFDDVCYIDTLVFGDSLVSFPLINDTIDSFEFHSNNLYTLMSNFHVSVISRNVNSSYIEVSENNPYLASINGSLYDKEFTTLLRPYLSEIVTNGFPETMKHIGNGVRLRTGDNIKMDIPDNLVSIGFFGIRNVTGWNYPGAEESFFCPVAFIGKDDIYTLTLPKSLEIIDDYGLTLCQNTNIILGENVKRIGYRAFYCWKSFHHGQNNEVLYCLSATPPEVGTEAFLSEQTSYNEEVPGKHKCVVVPMGSKAAYEQVPGIANYFEEIIEVEDVMAYYYEQLPVGIEEIENSGQSCKEIERYSLQGVRLKEPIPGINIIKYSDGTTKKVWVK